MTDFAAVGLVVEQPIVLVTRKDLPVSNMPEFIAYTKANHDKMQFGSSGVGSGSHFSCALLNAAIGVSPTHVPYRGSGPAHAGPDRRTHRLLLRARRRGDGPGRERHGEADRAPDQ